MVFGILAEVAMGASFRDGLADGVAIDPLEAVELVAQAFETRAGHGSARR
jgi:hypothetical protein